MLFGGVLAAVFFLRQGKNRDFDPTISKTATITVDGFAFSYGSVSATTVGELLDSSGLDISGDDEVFPDRKTALSSGMDIRVFRMKTVMITADGGTCETRTTARTVHEALLDAGVTVGDDDLVTPDGSMLLGRKGKVTVTRVEIREESVDKPIAFQTTVTEDPTLSWRKKITDQKGENGVRTFHYRVSYHDGKEVARKLLGSDITKGPTQEIVVQGTYVKVGKAATGQGTWYSYTGKLAAASLTLPLGSYARVTNPENGKSVIVLINDRGPYGKGRVIDLDRVAFQQIASLGAGIIDVKVEPVLN